MPKYSEYLLLVVLMWMLPDIAYAGTNSVATVLCKVGSYLWGPVGSIIAMLGVVALGLTAMFGKIQISSVLTIMVGISLIFGAQGILELLLGTSVFKGCSAISSGYAKVIINSQFYTILGCILSWFIGPIGKAIASLSLIVIGVFATYGRVSWHQAIVVAVGMAAMFGAVSIVATMGVPVYDKSGSGNIGQINLPALCLGGASSVISIEKVFCTIYNWFNGPIGKGIATTGMVILGVGALFGKISWGIAMVFAVGVGLIFGSVDIVTALGGPEDATTHKICSVGKLEGLNQKATITTTIKHKQ